MSTKKHTLRVYPSRKVKGQWGWTLIAPNGKKIADSCELYGSEAHAKKMARSMKTRFDAAELVVGAPKKAPAKFKAGMKVEITRGAFKHAIGFIKRRGLRQGEWIVEVPFVDEPIESVTISEQHLKVIK